MPNRKTYKERLSPVSEKQERDREYKRQWYKKNKEHVKRRVVERLDRLQEWFNDYKSTLVCLECGEDHPAVLDFHHRDGEEKESAVGLAVSNGWCKERILAEIAKCEVLCSNCHRKLHWQERQVAAHMRETT